MVRLLSYRVYLITALHLLSKDSAAIDSFAKQSTPSKLIVISAESASWNFVDEYLARHRLPNIEKLILEGARASVTPGDDTLRDVQQWHSSITGVPPEEHGIVEVKQKINGVKVLTTSNFRKASAIWNIASSANRSVGVVGPWASWPPEAVNGFYMSAFHGFKLWDRDFHLMYEDRPPLSHFTIHGSFFDDIELDQIYPKELFKEVAPIVKKVEATTDEEIRKYLTLPDHYEGTEEWIEAIKWVLTSDRIFTSAGLYLYQKYRPDLFVTYIHGLDAVGHRVLPKGLKVARSPKALEEYYTLLDRFLGELMSARDKLTTIILFSAHGVTDTGEHNQPVPGILVINGPNVLQGASGTLSVFDIAPTALYALELPVSRKIKGKISTWLFRTEKLKSINYIDSFEPPPSYDPVPRNTSKFSVAIQQRLERIGTLPRRLSARPDSSDQ